SGLTLIEQTLLVEQSGGARMGLGTQGELDRLQGVSGFLEPYRCALLQLPCTHCVAVSQSLLEKLCEQMVISVPTALIVHGEDEKIQLSQQIEPHPRIGPPGNEVTQLDAQPRQNRGRQQEIPCLIIQIGQHRITQKVRHIPVGARKAADQLRAVAYGTKPKGSQLQTGDPPLRALRKQA